MPGTVFRMLFTLASLALMAANATAQLEIGNIPAVSGHEQAKAEKLMEAVREFHPQTDNLRNVFVTFGSGAPHRLIAVAIDEPGYVVSAITEDGYLRVQRLPQVPPNAVFDALNFAQPVIVVTRSGKHVDGVFAGLSVHLQPRRLNSPKMNDVEELYVDIGAKTAQEARAVGVDILDPVALAQTNSPRGLPGALLIGKGVAEAGPAATGKVESEMLLQLARRMKESQAPGTTTIAFVTQQWLGGRGLNRLLTEVHPDEMVFVGRVVATGPAEGANAEVKSGRVLLGIPPDSKEEGRKFVEQWKAMAAKEGLDLQAVTAKPPRIAGYAKNAALPERFAELGVLELWTDTPGETVATADVALLDHLLEDYLQIASHRGLIKAQVGGGFSEVLGLLTETYGASGHEGAVREQVKRLLPEWARTKATSDAAGNLVLHLGDGGGNGKTPKVAFVAHMDEIGYEVTKIEEDGRLQVSVLGGGYPQYFLGHVALVHTKDGSRIGGVMELPAGWDRAGFDFMDWIKSVDEPAHVYVGTRTKEETEKLGVAPGDFMTIPKEYRTLLGTRASARSMDDRVGCAALIAAVKALGPELPGRDVTLVWSTQEEVGLKGAAAFAEQAAKDGRVPDFVFAIDTFVSSDSPLETKRFADGELGKGFVVRAVDNSNIVPLQYVDRVVALAKENGIPVQYGVTGGGNDGAVFTRYGSVDVALGWPLRYAHSPGEVIDTKDLDALGNMVEVIARKW